ncbi:MULTISPECIES: hypothetical protein [unclassified Streptomyces]|uniref:hypothetical protein n=1 Tax=unclassified Streptomyces TaxID=2593676 RepID=UPI00364EE493
MVVTVSLVLLLGIILFILLRSKSLGFGAAFVAVLFGFLLASTSAAGPVNEFTVAVVGALGELQ